MIVWGTPPTLMPGYRYISILTNNGFQETLFSAQKTRLRQSVLQIKYSRLIHLFTI